MTLVSVDAVIATATSLAPRWADRFVSGSMRCLRSIDSSTTIALSTSIPTPSISPIIESTFRLRPEKYITAVVARSEIGTEAATISVESQRRRKTKRTPIARRPPIRPA